MRALPALLLLSACTFSDLDNPFDALFDPVIAIGVVSTLEPPADEDLDLDSMGLAPGVATTVFLADASQEDSADAPIRGQTITSSGCGIDETLTDHGDGSYTLLPPTSHDACEGPFTLTREDADDPTILPISLPEPVTLTVPRKWTPGDDMILDLTTAGFDAALVTVIDGRDGTLVWTNEPRTSSAWFRLLTGEDDTGIVTVPGDSFEDRSIYGMTITGLQRGNNSDIVGANIAVSVIAGGRTYVFGVSTLPDGIPTQP